MTSLKNYLTDFVTSKDGTKIHYYQIGAGEGLVLVHGAMMNAQGFMTLAKSLSRDFTVYIPDRCGRGPSEMHEEYSLIKESEDIQALLNKTKARNIFGLSSGALIVLQTAILNSSLKKVALYEPPVPFSDINNDVHDRMRKDYESAVTEHNYGKALINMVKGTGDKGSLMKILPGFITIPFMNIIINAEAKKKTGKSDYSLKSLIDLVHCDLELVRESHRIIDQLKNIKADILLLGGERSQRFLKEALDKLNAAFPNAKKVVFPKIGHIAADNHGKPKLVAEALRTFFMTNKED